MPAKFAGPTQSEIFFILINNQPIKSEVLCAWCHSSAKDCLIAFVSQQIYLGNLSYVLQTLSKWACKFGRS